MARSGIGEETYIPRNIYEGREASCTLHDCLQELTEVTFTTLDELFATSGVSPSQIDIIITTGSLFAPVPSLTSRIVNKYNMKEGIKSYSLTGMGCSSSLIALDSVVRTHVSSDEAYECATHVEDDQGYLGARLTKALPKVAMQAMKENFKILLPKVLPIWEMIRYSLARYSKTKTPAMINMKAGIQHFCLHAGGRAVIDGFQKSFGLEDYDLEPSRMSLHRFGNTSCSSLWYVLGYMEAKKRLKKGDKVLMVGLGAGFLCNTCVWTVTMDLGDGNVWGDCVHRYPLNTMVNPIREKMDWLFDECMSFIRFEDYDRSHILKIMIT
ncbi:3-ketoacyl-CoA synthase 19 [Linum perenne]